MTGLELEAKKERIQKTRLDYISVAANQISKDCFLDAWWEFCATNKTWLFPGDKKPRPFITMSSSQLYTIRETVMEIANTNRHGALMLIGVITTILDEREADIELPF